MSARRARQPAPDAAVDPNAPSWPKTPGGTVDWEAVFEDPENGILIQFQRVVTPQAMRDSALATIKKLFTRKGDEEEAARLSSELMELITDDLPIERIELVRYAIIATFREIKTFRQKKAAEFELQKASKAKEVERRAVEQSKQSIKKNLAAQRQRKLKLVAAAAMVAVAVIGTGAYFYLRDPVYPPRADQILLQQMKSAAAGGSGRTHVYGGTLQTRRWFGDVTISAENIPVDACVSVGANLARSGTLTINGDLLERGVADAAREICQSTDGPIRLSWVPAQ
jgi:transcriptional regulator NrdR family protein